MCECLVEKFELIILCFQVSDCSLTFSDVSVNVFPVVEKKDTETQTDFVEETPKQTNTRKSTLKPIKEFNKCTRSGKCKKIQRLNQILMEEKMNSFELKPKTMEESKEEKELRSVFLRNSERLTEHQYAGVVRSSPNRYVPLSRLLELEKDINKKCPTMKTLIIPKPETASKCPKNQNQKINDVTLYYYDLKEVLMKMISWMVDNKKENLPNKLEFQLTGDYGGDTTKICCFNTNFCNSQSPFKLAILGIFYASDKTENIRPAIKAICGSFRNLVTTGIFINGRHFQIKM